jgi:hypothetical protein
MLMGSGFVLFMIMGLVICIEKLWNGDSSMGCLIPIIIVGIIAACFIGFLNLLTMM